MFNASRRLENVLSELFSSFTASGTLNQQVQIGRSSLKAAHLNDDTKEVAFRAVFCSTEQRIRLLLDANSCRTKKGRENKQNFLSLFLLTSIADHGFLSSSMLENGR